MKRSERHEYYMKECPPHLGLKEQIKYFFSKDNKGWRLFGKNGKLDSVWWEFRYAWQRAWRGYDFIEIISLNDIFILQTLLKLKELKKNMHTYACDMTPEEWEDTIEEMIIKFEKLYIIMFAIVEEEDEGEFDYIKCEKEALEMFVKHFRDLWD